MTINDSKWRLGTDDEQMNTQKRNRAILLLATITTAALVLVVLSRHGAPKDEVIERLSTAGGCDEIIKECSVLFERYRHVPDTIIEPPELKKFPALSKLGNIVGVWGESSNHPALVRVRYGSHWNTKLIYIFDSEKPLNPNEAAGLLKITSSIFVPNSSR